MVAVETPGKPAGRTLLAHEASAGAGMERTTRFLRVAEAMTCENSDLPHDGPKVRKSTGYFFPGPWSACLPTSSAAVGTTGVFAGAVPNAPAGVGRSARRCGWRLRRNLRSARRCGWWLRGNLRVKDG